MLKFKYDKLSPELEKRIKEDNGRYISPYACRDENAVRRDMTRDVSTALRPAFSRDIDKIINCPYFNRYADKTQVFSFYKNDDIARRALHVQLVSRIARSIGRALGLNLELIEAMALGHDMGHVPFAHVGENYIDALYYANTGRHFSHNLHSVRVLDGIFPYNVSLQTLDGICCHNGELELDEYRPSNLSSFEEFDQMVEGCILDTANIKKMIPSTLEGCVVRVSDIIAYLGKDRQDACKTNVLGEEDYSESVLGVLNAEIINNLTVNIVENSYGKPYIKMDREYYEALKQAKKENYARIYTDKTARAQMDGCVKPMMEEVYLSLLDDVKKKNVSSPIFTQHIALINSAHYGRGEPYENTEPNQIVVDYIASMTDDYFVDLHGYMFPQSNLNVTYKGYFDDMPKYEK